MMRFNVVMTWLREQAGDFYNAGIKKLVLRLTKCIMYDPW
jgi:hypothetical protein